MKDKTTEPEMAMPSPSLAENALLKAVGKIGDELGVNVYAVGGYVRDLILNRPTREIDFAVVGDGPALARRAREAMKGHGFVIFEKFGTASFLKDDFKLEFVTARQESYHPDSRNPDVIGSDLEADLARRDFTVNALAFQVNAAHFGEITDRYDGRGDMQRKIIRTPLDPGVTFRDDPLRIMRAVRFASQLQFDIESNTLAAISREKERLSIISQERITEEFLKILASPQPSVGLRLLQKSGVLAIIFPEMAALEGVEQRDDFHHKDVFNHTLKVVDNLARVTDDVALRFTGLVHDIGKPKVKRFFKGQGWTFHGHELVGVKMMRRIGPRLKLSRDMIKKIQKLTQLHMRPIHLIGEDVTDSAVRRLLVQAGDDVEDLMTLCRADITSGNPARVKAHLANFNHVTDRMADVEAKDRMRAFQSPVRGDEIMTICGIRPGPLVGVIKKRIEEAILEGEIPNEHEAAKAYLLKIKDECV